MAKRPFLLHCLGNTHIRGKNALECAYIAVLRLFYCMYKRGVSE